MEQQTALVTGASRGLGLALTTALAERGWQIIVDARDADALQAAVSHLGPQVIPIAGDITDPHHRKELAGAVGPQLHLLVNNAGALGPSPLPSLADFPLDALDELFHTNVVAQLGLVQEMLPALTAAHGTIVNITSDASVNAYEGWGGYGASKAALDHLGAVLAQERPDLRVLTIDPGDMLTQMHQDAFPGEDISDRPLPETSVPGLLALIDQAAAGSAVPSGRYQASAGVPT